MRGPWIYVALGVVTVPLWLLGCPGTLDPHEDDDAADDDAADDDASDDDASDDDAADDDASDDDASDDDAADDDDATDDDDASDDDASDDDDDSQPPPPGISFDVAGGPLAGSHLLDADVFCGWDGPWAVYAAADMNWSEYVGLYMDMEPIAGDHFGGGFGVEGLVEPLWFERYVGGNDCFADVISDSPVWGTFQCWNVDAWDYNNVYSMDITSGTFRCP